MPTIPAFKRLKEEDSLEHGTSLGPTVRPNLQCETSSFKIDTKANNIRKPDNIPSVLGSAEERKLLSQKCDSTVAACMSKHALFRAEGQMSAFRN